MPDTDFRTIEDIAPHVKTYLLPAIEEAVEVCVKSFTDDPFNDEWIFGTHLWKNIWNRLKYTASQEDCPFELSGKGNEYKLKIGSFTVRHHRIDRSTNLPRAAKAVKSAATLIQLMLFSGEWDQSGEKENIVIAIDADADKGLREVFIGELMPLCHESKKFRWIRKVQVFLAPNTEPCFEEIVQFPDRQDSGQMIPEEKNPALGLRIIGNKGEISENEDAQTGFPAICTGQT